MKKSKRTASIRHILSPSGNPFYTWYMLFRNSRSQESNASNGVQIIAKTKKLWPFEDNRTKLSENFATAKSACKINLRKFRKLFCSCKTTCRHTCATSQVQIPFLQLRIKLRNHLQLVKSPSSCKITNSTCKMDNINLRNFHKLHLNLRNPPV